MLSFIELTRFGIVFIKEITELWHDVSGDIELDRNNQHQHGRVSVAFRRDAFALTPSRTLASKKPP